VWIRCLAAFCHGLTFERVSARAGSDGGGVGKTKKALAEKQGPKVVVSRKRVVQANSSEDEDSAFDKHPGHASESEPQAKAQARAQVAKGRGKKVIGSQDEDDADDADDDDAAISEAEESDEDFESDEDDDFKGKKGKGKRLSDKGGKQTGKGKKQAHAKTTPASRSKKLSPPGKMPSHRNPPVRSPAKPALFRVCIHSCVTLMSTFRVARPRKCRLWMWPLETPVRSTRRQQRGEGGQSRRRPSPNLPSVTLVSKLLWARADQALSLFPPLPRPRPPPPPSLPRSRRPRRKALHRPLASQQALAPSRWSHCKCAERRVTAKSMC
jgi:hypothetical protein